MELKQTRRRIRGKKVTGKPKQIVVHLEIESLQYVTERRQDKKKKMVDRNGAERKEWRGRSKKSREQAPEGTFILLIIIGYIYHKDFHPSTGSGYFAGMFLWSTIDCYRRFLF